MGAFNAVILAAGYGKRMNSDLHKVLHQVGEISMIARVVRAAMEAGANKIVVVVGHQYNEIIDQIQHYPVEFAFQEIPRGTGDAVRSALPLLQNSSDPIVVLCGDVPLLKKNTILALVEAHNRKESHITMLTANARDPKGYGRIIVNKNTKIKIVEEKDCNESERRIKLINGGTYCFDIALLLQLLPLLNTNNCAGEYYLTDLIGIANENDFSINLLDVSIDEVQSVNTLEELHHVNSTLLGTGSFG